MVVKEGLGETWVEGEGVAARADLVAVINGWSASRDDHRVER